MRITSIKGFLVHPSSVESSILRKNWLLVKVETDEGIVGWGEAGTLKDREKAIAMHVDSLSRYLVGWNPFHIKRFTQMVYNSFVEGRGGVDVYCAMSGIEQAMWDIVGKSLNTPVYNLLGGPCRDSIKVYANGWTRGVRTTEELAQRAIEVVNLGFASIKFHPFLPATGKGKNESAVENVRAVREAVGPDIEILVDLWRIPEPSRIVQVAKMLKEFNILWYEEPVPSENLDCLAETRRAIGLPVVAGECLYTKHEIREILEKRAADILNPDICCCGGILEMKEMGAMAEPYHVSISPHNFNSTTMGLASIVQLAAVLPNFLIAEYFINVSELGEAISVNPLKVEGGQISLPTGPGLGLEISEESLKKFPFQEFPVRQHAGKPFPEGIAVGRLKI